MIGGTVVLTGRVDECVAVAGIGRAMAGASGFLDQIVSDRFPWHQPVQQEERCTGERRQRASVVCFLLM